MPPRKNLHGIAAAAVSFGQLERAMIQIFRVGNDRHAANRARMKHLLKLGLGVPRPGKGMRVAYTRETANQLLMAMLLADIGIDPVTVVRAVRANWQHLVPMVAKATEPRAQQGNHVFLLAKPSADAPGRGEGAELKLSMVERFAGFAPMRTDNLVNELNEVEDYGHRLCLVDFTAPASHLSVLLPSRRS
jgi:hypothetical protein